GTVCVVGKIRDLILQLSKSSIYSTKPIVPNTHFVRVLAALTIHLAIMIFYGIKHDYLMLSTKYKGIR
ncbi:hypothetical protein ACYKT4_06315, partial [Enterobacter hormaechei]